MPELPEADAIARTLAAALEGARVTDVRLRRRDFLKTGSARGLRRLVGRRIAGVVRRGKYVVLRIGPERLVIQLGMAGRVYVHPRARPLPAHTHLVLAVTGRREVRCANARRIAAGAHLLAAGREGPLARLGPDADAVGLDAFVERVGVRRSAVKAVLLNASVLAGVGNIYADEALFRARVRPTRRACGLRRGELRRLHAALRAVLAEAVAAGGSTVSLSAPFADADEEPGYFALSHRAYGRYGRPCARCRATLRRAVVAGRTSTYCPRCQR